MIRPGSPRRESGEGRCARRSRPPRWPLGPIHGMWRVSQKTLNLGILAHVDAGKTTLTERLLYDSGVIDQLGAVDAGTTQTDSLPLERRRGITIKSAVASFPIGDVTVNLMDTRGDPGFIAEVARRLTCPS